MGPHGIPRGCCRANPAMVAPSKRNCRIAQRIARAPRRARGVHTEWFCSIKVAMAGGFAAYPSPYCATGSAPGPRPRARRSPPPPYDRGLARFSPQPGHPASWLHDSISSTRASGVRATLIALQTDEQITPITTITTIKRHTAAGRVRHRPRSFEDRGGRSPLITWDLDLYPQPPTNTRSPTLNSEEPVFSGCHSRLL